MSGGRLLDEQVAQLLLDNMARENELFRWTRARESWESRLKREIWRRSLRGRWWLFIYRLREKTEGIRRRIALRIYHFREDDW